MKKTITNFKVVLSMLAFMLVMIAGGVEGLKAQNIAPLATASAAGGTNPAWNWNRINDLDYGTCGTQLAFVWSATPPNGSEYMLWEWTQPYPINKIVIFHAQTTARFLTGGTIQYWDGSAWVNHYTFSGLPTNCDNTITFPILISDKLRITSFQMTAPGQISNPNFREIEIWQGALPGTHARATNATNKGENCGGAADSVSISVQNIGLNKLGTFWVGATATGTINGSPVSFSDSVQYTGDSVKTGETISVNFFNFNSLEGGNLDIKGWVNVAADTGKTDDTVWRKVTILGGPTSDPSPKDNDRCGSGSIALDGGAPKGNTVYWYDAPTGGTLVGKGNSFNTPNIPGGTNKTYYAASVKQSGDSTHTYGYTGTTIFNPGFMGGNMFDVAIKKPITIDSINLHLNLTATQEITLYIKAGGISNDATNPAAWTLIQKKDVKANGYTFPTTYNLDKPLYLEPGVYGVYIFASNNSMVFDNLGTGSKVVQNAAIESTLGLGLSDSFQNVQGTKFGFNGEFFYHEACIKNNRLAANATAKPLPVGAGVSKGSTFQGQFVAGSSTQPDIVANPDVIEYELNPPTGFNNSDFGTTWTIPMITVQTSTGNTVATTNYSVTNPGSGNGKFEFKPSAGLTDSLIKVSMVIRRTDNNCDSLVERYIFVAPRPQVSFSTNTACVGDPIEFKNASSITSGTVEYDWDFADGNGSDLSDPFHAYNSAGMFNAKLIVTSNYGYKDSMTLPVQVFAVPDPNFTFNNACEGAAIQLFDASSLPTGTPTHSWNFGDGTTGSGANTSKQYSTPDIYPVTLIVEVNGCSNRITKYVTQAPRAVPAFTVDLGECDNKNVGFSNTSTDPAFGSASYIWKFGDGKEAAGINTVHTYNTFNTYTATLVTRTDLGCRDSITGTVTLKESPKADFTGAGKGCTNEVITFTNATNIPSGSTNTYEWDFGDASSSTLDDPMHVYSAQDEYKVTLKAMSTNGCEGVITKTVNVEEKPISDFTVTKVCEGDETSFTNNSTSTSTLSYQWDLGNGSTPTTTNPKETYANAGSYNISLIATSANGCSDTATQTAIVGAIPTVDINVASNQTQDGTMLFATSATGVTYKWFFGDGATSDQQNPTYQFKFPTRYTVRLVVTNADGCSNSTTTEVNINPLSVGTIDGNNWSVYPNPTAGKFYIKYQGADIATVKVSDILGKTIAIVNPELANNEVSFDLSNQKAGVYIVTVTDVNGNTGTQKITLSK